MELGDPTAQLRIERSPLDMALDAFDTALNDLIDSQELPFPLPFSFPFLAFVLAALVFFT